MHHEQKPHWETDDRGIADPFGKTVMSHTELRTINKLAIADKLELSEDVRLYRVLSIEPATAAPRGSRQVNLQSLDGTTRIMLVRQGHEFVRVVVD
jgi:hypothetical protein